MSSRKDIVELRSHNLAPTVSSDRLETLFGKFNSFIGATVHYDRCGESLGTGEAIYRQRADAEKAIEKYDGFPLHYSAMIVEFVDGTQSESSA